MTKTQERLIFAFVVIIATALLCGFLFLVGKAIVWTANVDGNNGKPVKTFYIHISYDANEDMVSCPGTPGAVLDYIPGPNGQADILCAAP